MQTKPFIFALSSMMVLTAAAPVFAQTSAPKLSIITPQADRMINGDKVPVLISVPETIKLTDYRANPNPTPGQGHILLWLDDQNPTAESAIKLTEDTFTFSDVPEGDHTLKAELVNNNHTPLNPADTVTVKFKSAPAGSPAPAPKPNFDKNTAAVILVVVALVIVAAWWYTKEDDEEPVKEESKKPVTKSNGKGKKAATTKKKKAAKSRK